MNIGCSYINIYLNLFFFFFFFILKENIPESLYEKIQLCYKLKDYGRLEKILSFFKFLSLYKDSAIHIVRITGKLYI